MRQRFLLMTMLVLAWTVGGPVILSARAAPPADKVDYNFHVRPILSDRCFFCHGPDEKVRKAGLRLDIPEGPLKSQVIVPGKPEESELVRRITATDKKHMPPARTNLTLTEEEIGILRRWIAEGAEYKPHWAFLPLPDAVSLPAVSDPLWPARGLDHFVLARLDREKLKPSPPAPKEDWLRRVTFDLTGLPPTPQEVEAFLADDSGQAFERVVDRLLASPRFGERLAQEWLDVARYADSFGYQADGDSLVWPWRDWVIRAFNQNLPFDQFVTWQLAGDLLDHPSRDQRLATAFNRLHRMTNEGGSIPEEFRLEYVADRVQTFGTALLGLTLECSRCHDHKYDPITQRDYYGLGAFFNSIDEWGTYDSSRFLPPPTLSLPTPDQQKRLGELTAKVKDLEARLAELRRSRESAFREWLAGDDLKAEVPGLVGYYPFHKTDKTTSLINEAAPDKPGSTSAANKFVPGRVGDALQFTGDDPANFPGVLGTLERDQPFTAAFWLQVPQPPQQGIVFHRQSGTDTGFHGVELSFEDGRLFFGLIRFLPGNMAAVRTKAAFPAREWVHVAVSHDGSGKAAGLRIYLNGKPADTEVIRDTLNKNLEPSIGHGAGSTGPSFGERFRSTGLKGGLLDELRLYDRALTAVEIAHVHDGQALTDALKRKDEGLLGDYYFGAIDAEAKKTLAELRQARQQLFAVETEVPEVMTMQELPQPLPAHVLYRGQYDTPKDRVERNSPAALPPFPKDLPRDRLGLARWVTDPRHPLTARVTVNRFWQMFFGRGLVSTPENFGIQGALPTHPDLLDWLARDFIASGWDVKELCKTIVLSSTYRQRSASSKELRERDPDNLLLVRGPTRRLSAEMLRD